MKVRVFFSCLLIAGVLTGVVVTVVSWVVGAALPGFPVKLIAGLVSLCLGLVLIQRMRENRMSFLLGVIAFTGPTLDLTTSLVELTLDRQQAVSSIRVLTKTG